MIIDLPGEFKYLPYFTFASIRTSYVSNCMRGDLITMGLESDAEAWECLECSVIPEGVPLYLQLTKKSGLRLGVVPHGNAPLVVTEEVFCTIRDSSMQHGLWWREIELVYRGKAINIGRHFVIYGDHDDSQREYPGDPIFAPFSLPPSEDYCLYPISEGRANPLYDLFIGYYGEFVFSDLLMQRICSIDRRLCFDNVFSIA